MAIGKAKLSIDTDKLAEEQAAYVAAELLRAARTGATEADFRRDAARLLEDAAIDAGLKIERPKDEVTVARGRVDSLYNRLILEYKRPGLLKPLNTAPPNRAAIEQLKEYITDVGVKSRREAQRLAGVVTDGHHFIFVRRVGEGWAEDEAVPVDGASTAMFLRLLFSLSTGAALIPENLVEDFGPQNFRSKNAVRALYRAFSGTKSGLVGKLFEQWRLFFSEATDYRQWAEKIESKPEFKKFVASLWTKDEIRHLDPARVFFVLHTYYALLIKLVASLAAARFAGGPSAPLSSLAAKRGDDLRKALAELERGGLFRELGVRNFLEGDFFGWYLAAWDQDVEDAASSLISRLAEYDPGSLELAPENARDLLKKLYHYLLPKEIRHDLGEYYTPDWLADRVIRQTLGTAGLGDATKRILDPACGSGTFLVLIIKHIRERATRKNQDPATTLGLILQNVVGFDLNPLAVIASRTNYLIALGDLLKARTGDIDIPVYQADSVRTPSQGTDLFEGSTYPLKTAVGTFRIPTIFEERDRMDALANVLDESVESGISESAFLSRVTKAARLEDEEQSASESGLKELYRQLRELHDDGINGVWARIIKNAFAPNFLEPCHYVVGNPPWINWQHLPDEYRDSTKPLWQHYGLFPERETGMQTILGGAKYDFSTLMTYVALDKYLRRNGKLGFVITQTVFKTAAAGQGFRRFVLPDGTPCGPLLVDDMTTLSPFEGAANRTSVAVFGKGHRVKYPVSYTYWVKRARGRGSGFPFDTPYESVVAEFVTFRQWLAEPVDGKDPTSAWITDRRGCLKALRHILGRSDYIARKGVTCSANGVFWVERIATRPDGSVIVANVIEGAKQKVGQVQAAVEEELVYPLLRGKDVNRWSAVSRIDVIMTHKPGMRLKAIPIEEMQSNHPKTWGYLSRFRDVLTKTGIYRRFFKTSDPFYSAFNVGDYTFAEHKVVWREIASDLVCAVIGEKGGKSIIPDHKLTSIATRSPDEAHYICAVLNSSLCRLVIRRYTPLSVSPHVMSNLRIPRFSKEDPVHLRLVELSVRAHKAAAEEDHSEIGSIDTEIDEWAAKLWDLSDLDLREIQRSLAEG